MSELLNRERVRVLHVMVLDKFIPGFIDFVRSHFDIEQHGFFLIGSPSNAYGLSEHHPVSWIDTDEKLLQLVDAMNHAERIILHGLWSDPVNRILSALPSLTRKAHWVIWGGDLYRDASTLDDPVWLAQETVRYQVISNLAGLVGIPGDMSLVKERYGCTGGALTSLVYTSNLAPERPATWPRKRGDVYRILVGNSATESNCHLEALSLIARRDEGRFEVYCPLSYGDAGYRDLVIANGKALFGDRFHAITDMMPLAAYNTLLSQVDAAVLNHNRQQGMGNAITLLGLGKKVYMRPNQTHTRFLNSLGVATYALSDFDTEAMPDDLRDRNVELIGQRCSRAQLIRELSQLFGTEFADAPNA